MGETHTLYLDGEGRKVPVRVTLIDANHCPGSVMFLLEGYFGRILHTGDCRFTPSMLENDADGGLSERLFGAASGGIDVMYLDNTFGNPRHQFPSRNVAAEQALEIVKAHPDSRVVFGIDTLGKEELLHYIAVKTGESVGLPPQRLQAMELMGIPEYLTEGIFTDDLSTTRLAIKPKHRLTKTQLTVWEQTAPTIGILLSGWHYGRESDGSLHFVPYSLHSSYPELVDFVRRVRPRSVRATSDSTPEGMENLRKMCEGLLDPSPHSVTAVTLHAALRGSSSLVRSDTAGSETGESEARSNGGPRGTHSRHPGRRKRRRRGAAAEALRRRAVAVAKRAAELRAATYEAEFDGPVGAEGKAGAGAGAGKGAAEAGDSDDEDESDAMLALASLASPARRDEDGGGAAAPSMVVEEERVEPGRRRGDAGLTPGVMTANARAHDDRSPASRSDSRDPVSSRETPVAPRSAASGRPGDDQEGDAEVSRPMLQTPRSAYQRLLLSRGLQRRALVRPRSKPAASPLGALLLLGKPPGEFPGGGVLAKRWRGNDDAWVRVPAGRHGRA